MTGGANPGFARGRRLRSTPAMRRWTAQTRLAPADLVEALATYAVELREKLAAMPAKQRRGSKVQGPTALRFR